MYVYIQNIGRKIMYLGYMMFVTISHVSENIDRT